MEKKKRCSNNTRMHIHFLYWQVCSTDKQLLKYLHG